MKLLISDRTEVFTYALLALFQSRGDLKAEIQACRLLEIYGIAQQYKPDIVFIHFEDPFFLVVDQVRAIVRDIPSTKIVLMTHSKSRAEFYSAVAAGVRAFLSTDTRIENLVRTINLLYEEGVLVSTSVAAEVITELEYLHENGKIVLSDDYILLSNREKAVLALVAKGYLNSQIAEILAISKHTVKVHISNIMEKLEVHSRQQAVAAAIEKGLISNVFESADEHISRLYR